MSVLKSPFISGTEAVSNGATSKAHTDDDRLLCDFGLIVGQRRVNRR